MGITNTPCQTRKFKGQDVYAEGKRTAFEIVDSTKLHSLIVAASDKAIFDYIANR
jgi:hypothetical protein